MQVKDDWEKPRSKGQHLTAEEIQLLKSLFKTGHSGREAARTLKCSSRVASKYYSFFVAEGVVKNAERRLPSPPAPRHYKSDFTI